MPVFVGLQPARAVILITRTNHMAKPVDQRIQRVSLLQKDFLVDFFQITCHNQTGDMMR